MKIRELYTESKEVAQNFQGQEYEVLVNPSPREAESLFEYCEKVLDDGDDKVAVIDDNLETQYIRYLSDGVYNLYMWPAFDLIHEEVRSYFGIDKAEFGVITNRRDASHIAREYAELREHLK